MNDIFDASVILSQLELPPQDIKVLSFCASNKTAKVQSWASHLRLTQTKQTSVALYDAIPEINHLKTDAKSRYDMLEAVWPAVKHCTTELAKHFLQQPLILPPVAQKTAVLSQALQKHLLDGYLLCIQELSSGDKLKSSQRALLANCLYRGIRRISVLMLRCFQLYTAPPPGMWQRLHLLYSIADQQDLLFETNDLALSEKAGCRTLAEAYTRICAVASLRPNQLSQKDITHCYDALENWARQIKLSPAAPGSEQKALYFVELNSDKPPFSAHRFRSGEYGKLLILGVEGVADQVKRHLFSGRNSSNTAQGGAAVMRGQIDVPSFLPSVIQEHIVRCWSATQPRTQKRQQTHVTAMACFGLSDCHYHIAGADFEHFSGAPENTDSEPDGLGDLLSRLGKKESAPSNKKGAQDVVIDLTIRNTSEGGYCVTWQDTAAQGRIESGELIAIKESDSEGWRIGIIRWIRQLKGSTQAGVQLITGQPVAYAAAMLYDMGGETDFMRAIHVPAPSSPDIEPGILTPSAPFKEMSKVKLKQHDQVINVQFQQCILSTNKVKLFAFATADS